MIVWKDKEDRVSFFLEYATKRGFDPYNPENWYSQSRDNIFAEKVIIINKMKIKIKKRKRKKRENIKYIFRELGQ